MAKGNSRGGLGVYMRTIRAIYNKAIKAGIAEEKHYPFKNYRIKSGKPRKRALSLEAIRKIKELKLEEGSQLERDRNIFLLSFYLRGIPFADLARLKCANIIDGRIQYNRHKTASPLTIKIPDQAWPILNEFCDGKEKEDYILGAVKHDDDIQAVQGCALGAEELQYQFERNCGAGRDRRKSLVLCRAAFLCLHCR